MAEIESIPKRRKVMVAVDQSKESMHALEWALQFLGISSETTDLILFHGQPTHVVATPDGYLFSSDVLLSIEKYQLDSIEGVFENAKEICKSRNLENFECKRVIGDAREVICEEVEKEKPDVLVLGSHGYGTIKRTLLGSVSDHCAHNAKCPVLRDILYCLLSFIPLLWHLLPLTETLVMLKI